MSNVIDSTALTYLDAPLNSVRESEYRADNKSVVDNSGVGYSSLNPYLYNKTAMIEVGVGYNYQRGGGIGNIGDPQHGNIRGFSVLGKNVSVYPAPNGTAVFVPSLEDYAIYIEVAPLSEYGTDYNYYEAELVTTGYKKIRGNYQQNIVTPYDDMGKTHLCNVVPFNSEPVPTHQYDSWVYVKNWTVYNRAAGNTNPRTPYKFPAGTVRNIFPCILWDCQNVFSYTYDNGKPKISTFTGDLQGFTFLSLLPRESCQLGTWRFINTYRISQGAISDPIVEPSSQVIHNSKLGDNAKFLMFTTQQLVKWCHNANSQEWFYYDNRAADSANNFIFAFKTIDDIFDLLKDWGVTRVSDDLDDVQNMPSELFPGVSGGDTTTPDGGESIGYDDNSVIPSIPSYADNTSDIINVLPPNISAINAASVYVLTITGVKNLLNWLLTDEFTKNLSELFGDKISALDNLSIMPVDFVTHDPNHTEQVAGLTIANVTSTVGCYKLLAGYNCIIHGGDYHYTAYWGDFNDYANATYYLYIPYGGVVEMAPSHVVNRDLRLEYALDIITGAATAIVYSNDVLVKTVPCQFSQTVPISVSNTNQREIRNSIMALNVGTSILGTVASGGNIVGALLGGATSAVSTLATNPLRLGSVGNFSSNTSMTMPQIPFLIISRVQQAIPSNRSRIVGRPSNNNRLISDFIGSGFCQIDAFNISTTATTEEQQQIINLLREGIFL